MTDDESPAKRVEVFDKNVDPSKWVAFSHTMVIYYDGPEVIQRRMESKMGVFVHNFQPGKVTTIEQTERNLTMVEAEPQMHILKRNIKGAPSHETVRELRDRYLNKDAPEEKKGVFESIKEKVSPKKKKGKKK